MARNRIHRPAMRHVATKNAGITPYGLPPAAAGLIAVAMVGPPAQIARWQQLYQLAYRQAQRALEPPRHVRQFCTSLN